MAHLSWLSADKLLKITLTVDQYVIFVMLPGTADRIEGLLLVT